jgi:hypothetical protein
MRDKAEHHGLTPVPLSEMVCVVPGKLRELSVTVAEPVSVPTAVGANVIQIAQLNPAPISSVASESCVTIYAREELP